jgi:WD40 repeat protein
VLGGHSEGIFCISLSSDGKTIYSGFDTTIRVWNLKKGECVQALAGHSYLVTCVSLSSDGKTMCSGSHDCTVRVWNLKKRECIQTL